MKFLHTSDWHLGRQFHNVSLLEDQRYVLKQLIDYLKNNAVDAVIVAGMFTIVPFRQPWRLSCLMKW